MPVDAQIVLGSAGQEGPHGVSALGLGWQVRPPEPMPWAVVVVILAPRELIGTELPAYVLLEDYAGTVLTSGGKQCRVDFDAAPEGITEGLESPVVHPYSFTLPPLRLEPDREYRFRLWVDGETRDGWIAPFRTTSE